MTNKMMTKMKPRVCVVIEGYNEAHSQGTVNDTMDALAKQDYPLDRIEIVLAGSIEQTTGWRRVYAPGQTPFASVETIEAEEAHYYELKNNGAQHTTCEIIAFTDSDVCPKPSWLRSMVESIESGADVSVGLSLFRQETEWSADKGLLPAAALMTFGWIVGKREGALRPQPQGFLAHNVAFRTEVFRKHPYRTEFGRTCASVLLFQELKNANLKVVLQPDQLAGHYFTWSWWLRNFHFRVGYEVFMQRRIDQTSPSGWAARTGILEPLVTMAWHTYSDIPRWFRFSKLLRMNPARRVAMLPAVVALSFAARGAEMLGMYYTLAAPQAMRRWAETS